MAITLDNATSTTIPSGSATSIIANAPSNIEVGDILLAFVIGPSANPVSASGWTPFTQPGFGTVLLRSITGAQGAIPSTYTFSIGSSSGGTLAIVILVKGLSSIFAYEGQTGAATGLAGTAITCPSVTTTRTATEVLISFYYSASAAAITVPVSQTLFASINANGVAGAVAYETLSAVGTTGTRVATAGASAPSAAFGIAIIPPLVATTVDYEPHTSPTAVAFQWWALAGGAAVLNGVTTPYSLVRKLPVWEIDVGGTALAQRSVALGNDITGSFLAIDVLGTISGTTKINSVLTPNVWVYLYHRPSGVLINRIRSDASGAWSFSGLDRTKTSDTSYFAVAVYPNGQAVQYNSLVYDRLIPA